METGCDENKQAVPQQAGCQLESDCVPPQEQMDHFKTWRSLYNNTWERMVHFKTGPLDTKIGPFEAYGTF